MTCGTTTERAEIQRLFLGLALEAQKQIPISFNPKKRVIVLAGPTGCGKTAFALELAKMMGGEIISADSMQVYRGMDIGTAKASKEERLLIPHHLLDIRDITENFNVVDFYYEARHCCQQVLDRGSVPIIVGGSGFYLHALLYGPPSGPPSVPEVRKTLEDEFEAVGPEVLYERLRRFDPEYAHTINKHDKQKIIRALEIITLTGKKVSRFSWATRIKPQGHDFHCWFLHRPKDLLYKRIEKRCDRMLADGFMDEVKLLEQQGLRTNSSASQAIGYRQALDYLASPQTSQDYTKFVEHFKQASRNYAKRQITWFKREPLFRWLDIELHDYEVAIDIIEQDYQAR